MDNGQKNKIMHGHIMLTETGGISGADALWPVEKGSAEIYTFTARRPGRRGRRSAYSRKGAKP
jgi:hypothetical protein